MSSTHLDLTRHNLGWTMVLFVVLGVLFGYCHLVVVSPAPAGPGMPVEAWIVRLAGWLPRAAALALVGVVIFWNGLVLARIISRNMILQERTYLPFILYLLLSAGLTPGNASAAPYVAALLLVSSADLMIDSFRRTVRYTQSFDAALLIGLSVLVYAPGAIYALLLPCALVIFRKGWREWLSCFTGLGLPLLIASYVGWGLGRPFGEIGARLLELLGQRWAEPFPWAVQSSPWIATAGILTVAVTLLALLQFVSRRQTMRTRPYKACLYFVWMLLFSLGLLLSPGASVADMPLAAIPLAVIMPLFFNRFGGWMANAAYLLLLGTVVGYDLFLIFS